MKTRKNNKQTIKKTKKKKYIGGDVASLQDDVASPQDAIDAPQDAITSPQVAIDAPQDAITSPQVAIDAPQDAIATPQAQAKSLVAFRAAYQASQADKIPCPVDAKGVVEQLVEASKLPEGAKARAAKNCQQKFTAKKKKCKKVKWPTEKIRKGAITFRLPHDSGERRTNENVWWFKTYNSCCDKQWQNEPDMEKNCKAFAKMKKSVGLIQGGKKRKRKMQSIMRKKIIPNMLILGKKVDNIENTLLSNKAKKMKKSCGCKTGGRRTKRNFLRKKGSRKRRR